MDEREEFAAGLRALAAAIETDPDLPLPDGRVELCVLGSDDEVGCAQIDGVAAALGVDAAWGGGYLEHYAATATFGPITYRAFYCSRAAMERFRAEQSYTRNITAVA